MSSALTITYSSPTAAAGTPAAATTGSAAPAANNPLGFLAALVDQLLSGGATATVDPTATPTDASTDPVLPAPAVDASIPALFNVGLDLRTPAPAKAPGTDLLAELTKDLQALKDQLDAGQTPDPDLLKKLGQSADALAAMMAAPTPAVTPAAPAIDPASALDPLKAIAAANAALAPPKLPDIPGVKKPAAQQPLDQVSQILASLGFTAPATDDAATDATPATTVTASASATTPTAAQPLPALAQLASKLADATAAIAPLSPEIAQKLQALTQKLTAAEADPTLLAQLTSPADTDGSQLDQIVRSLLDSKPAPTVPTTPQLATTAKLDVPADIVPPQPKAKTETEASLPEAKPASHTTAKIAVTSHAAESADPKPQVEAKIVAAATSAVTADKPAATDPTAAQQSAPVAPTTAAAPLAARAIPAAYQAATSPINMGQMAFEMVRQLHQGQSRFSIRIDPPELGRVDVKMHVDATGTVNARLTVERSETLDMFQRDRGALEKAMAQAGLDSSKTNLEFSLKQQNNPFASMGGDQRQQGGGNAGFKFSSTGDDDTSAIPAITLYRGTASAGGVNLFV